MKTETQYDELLLGIAAIVARLAEDQSPRDVADMAWDCWKEVRSRFGDTAFGDFAPFDHLPHVVKCWLAYRDYCLSNGHYEGEKGSFLLDDPSELEVFSIYLDDEERAAEAINARHQKLRADIEAACLHHFRRITGGDDSLILIPADEDSPVWIDPHHAESGYIETVHYNGDADSLVITWDDCGTYLSEIYDTSLLMATLYALEADGLRVATPEEIDN